MKVINWLGLQLSEREIHVLQESINGEISMRKLSQILVRSILEQYPWNDRIDLISLYHPRNSYKQGDWIALPKPDEQSIRSTYWQIAKILEVEQTENEIQGKFDVITLDLEGKQFLLAAAIPNSSYSEQNFTEWTPGGINLLAEYFADTYAKSIQSTIRKMISSGKLSGSIVGESILPNGIHAIPENILTPFFVNLSEKDPWISIEEILQEVSLQNEFDHNSPETLRSMLNLTLEKSSYVSLGGNRWTTQEIFDELNRDILRGLPVPHVHSKIWTEKDKQDFSQLNYKILPKEELIDEGETIEHLPENRISPWYFPNHPIRLPVLSYLHIAQAYFPISHIMGAFPPDSKLLFVQIIEGEYQSFFIDRNLMVLKALDIEKLRITFLDPSIPAGTHLWLEYQGKEHYRITPRPLPAPRYVPCKRAYLENGVLHIELNEIPMRFEGDPSVFKADLRFEDIEALFEEAQRNQLSVRDAIIQSVQELCAIDPQERAYYRDIFNVVFLKRMCSYNSVRSMLYTHPCFIQLSDGFFRYDPHHKKKEVIHHAKKSMKVPHRTPIKIDKRRVIQVTKKQDEEVVIPPIAQDVHRLDSTPTDNLDISIKKQITPTLLLQSSSESLSQDQGYPSTSNPIKPLSPQRPLPSSILNKEEPKTNFFTKSEINEKSKSPLSKQNKTKKSKLSSQKKFTLVQRLLNGLLRWWNVLKREIWRKRHG